MARSTRVIVIAAVAAAVLAVVAFAVNALWDTAKKAFVPSTCTAGNYELDPAQASVAATMVGAVTKYRVPLPQRASVLVLAAALQESKLVNIPPGGGDRDSVGVLQQRPSQGWGGGDPLVLTDVGEATKEFLDRLLRDVPNWRTLPVAEAIQQVQISADGTLYAQHEPQAEAFADALAGRTPAGISCEFDEPSQVASATTVAQQVGRDLGIKTATATDRRTVRVPGARWQTAAWFVANADRLGIDKVAYNGRQWTRADGWKTSSAPAAAVVATMAEPAK